MVSFPTGAHPIKDDKLGRLKWFLQLHGTGDRSRYILMILTILKYFIFIGQTVYAIQSFSEPKKAIDVVATYPIPLLTLIKLTVLHLTTDTIQKLYVTIEKDFWDVDIVDEALRRKINRRFNFVNGIILNHTLGASLGAFLCIAFPTVGVPEGNKRLPILMWTPFNINPSPIYEILFVCTSLTTSMSVFGNAFIDFLFIYCCQHIVVQFMILGELLKNITDGLMEQASDLEKFQSDKFQARVMERLKICIKHHAMLKKYGNELRNYYSIIMLIQLGVGLVAIVSTSFMIIVNHDDFKKTFMLLALSSTCAIQLSIYAIQSTDLMEQSSSLAEAAYQTKWYLFKAPLKRALARMMMNSNVGIEITAFYMQTIDNTVIIFVGQKVMSIITLLRSFQDDS